MTAQVGYGPLTRIDGPRPIPPLHGLLAAAEAPAAGVQIVVDVDGTALAPEVAAAIEGFQIPHAGEERWLNGAQVYPYPPSPGGLFDTCSLGSDPHSKDFGVEVSLPEFGAFTVYLAETCTSYKVWNQEEFKARAVAALTAVESSLVAKQLLSGAAVLLNPHLADGNGTFPNLDAATKPSNGIGLLEGEIAKSGRQGVIHCSPMLATALMGSGFALTDKTGVIRTINGIVVVPDFGYVVGSTPPTHAAPGTTAEWAFATGPIDIRRSEIFTTPDNVAQALDRGTPHSAGNTKPNSITYRAERHYLVTWDTEVQAAVLVDRCQTTC